MGQQQNNYFTNMISRFNGNENFIIALKPEHIQRSAKERIFREMIKGQIDYTQFGNYFLDSKFLENLIIAADNELTNNSVISTALQFYDMNFPGDVNIRYNTLKYQNLVIIYQNLLYRLQMVKESGNIGYLTDFQYVIRENTKFI